MTWEFGKTLEEIIDYVDEMVPNAFTHEQKTRWISELDGDIALDVFKMENAGEFYYTYPKCKDWHVLLRYPFDNLYELYVSSKLDVQNAEYDKYSATSMIFNARMDEFKVWFYNKYGSGVYAFGIEGR